MATESFFSNASLAYLASAGAGKDGKTYSIKPTDGSGDFTFSRGSNLAATRVGPTGLIEKGRENLFTQSNNFDTLWSLSGLSTPTTGFAGYDGSSNAWLLETTAASGRISKSTSLSGVHTISFYAKKGNVDYIAFFGIESGGNFPRAWFNLTGAGAVSNTLHEIDANIEAVSGATGWFRCSIVFDKPVSDARMYPSNTAGSFSTGAGESVYIQDAQLEIGLAATDYIESGATTGKAGILEDTPRFDYSGGATCPSLLLEPSRTNLIEYSEYINEWQQVNISTEISDTLSPDGISPMTKAIFTNQGLNSYIRQNKNMDSGSITVSIFVKKGLIDSYASIRIEGIDNNISVWFNLDNGTIGSETGSPTNKSIVSYGNGIYRISATTTSTTDLSFSTKIQSANTDGGDPTENATQFYWGGQAEAGSYPTSYIPNHSGGSVTRGLDVCEGAGDATTFNSTEGVLYAEISALEDLGTARRYISLSDGSTNNDLRLYFNNSVGTIVALSKVGGVTQFGMSNNGYDLTQTHKIAVKYKVNDFALWIDGVEVDTDSSGLVNAPNTFNELAFNGNALPFFGKAKQVLVFNTTLSDADLATLTTL